MVSDDEAIARFNALPDAVVRRSLRSCCASTVWVDAVASGRPFADRAALLACAHHTIAALDWPSLREALDAHPRIGERMEGGAREATWSRHEQSGMLTATQQSRTALAEANRAYEQRFGHVFLIFATGRTDAEMLAAARQRLGNDEATEHEVVRIELSHIVALRLRRLLEEEPGPPPTGPPPDARVDEP